MLTIRLRLKGFEKSRGSSGRKIAASPAATRNDLEWKDDKGRQVAAGIHFCRPETPGLLVSRGQQVFAAL
ncbi:hypothetical protein CH330_02640 [candidate division WOR-3 bacterium JGI_Cruoil_03_51_56]|uniref:Uncharacterized protein n=1 Tax=candidate division WOR-3 bacterium JGI_Cruoil_03_51_56 TaxID=1973747 RepID=A0A235BWE0_UNCW3|nr:MAG: hypothetical protein CH330_02640 [candidate division WOR-3 bacterium JGI_Cruoil_03_51_56]